MSDPVSVREASAPHAAVAHRQGRLVWWFAYASVVMMGLLITAFVSNRPWQPYVGMSLGLIVLLSALWLTRPRFALYATLFLTTLSDIVAARWFPFAKSLSSRESIAFVADAATISPLEISLFVGVVATSLRRYARTGRVLPPNPLVRPMFCLFGFVLFGFAHGVLTGGSLTIAVFESRGLFYVFAVFVVTISVCTRPEHYEHAVLAVFAGVVVHALITLQYYFALPSEERAGLDSLGEHGASVTMNLVFIALFAGVLFKSISRLTTTTLVFICVPVGAVYLLSQRRAAVAALAVAVVSVLVMLAWRRRRTFLKVVPVIAILTTVYVGAFWNSTGTAGFPAQAIKGAVAPGSATAEDRSSDQYRIAESVDVNATIRSSPILGLGFGHEFLRPIPLPRINDFLLARYVPHNSFLWIWIKLGFLGFATMVYVLMKSIVLGVARTRELIAGRELMTTVIGVLYIVMFAVYTWVDISWDPRLTPVLGLAIAVCSQPIGRANRDEFATARDEPAPPHRRPTVPSGAPHEGARPRQSSPMISTRLTDHAGNVGTT